MRPVRTMFVALALAAAPLATWAPAVAAPATLSPADTAAAEGLAKQIEDAILPLPKDTTHADMQKMIQQLIIASGLSPAVVLDALNIVEQVLLTDTPNEPSFALAALHSAELRVLAQNGETTPAAAGGGAGGGGQIGGPALSSTGGTATD